MTISIMRLEGISGVLAVGTAISAQAGAPVSIAIGAIVFVASGMAVFAEVALVKGTSPSLRSELGNICESRKVEGVGNK